MEVKSLENFCGLVRTNSCTHWQKQVFRMNVISSRTNLVEIYRVEGTPITESLGVPRPVMYALVSVNSHAKFSKRLLMHYRTGKLNLFLYCSRVTAGSLSAVP